MLFPSAKKYVFYLFLVFAACTLHAQIDTGNLQYANPLVGTRGLIFYGRCTPYVATPFAMTDWTACTRKGVIGACSYRYLGPYIKGFRGSHKPAMCMGDYGYFELMPVTGYLKANKVHFKACYTHKHEVSRPEYYSVQLDARKKKKSTKVEIASTSRSALFKITYPANMQHHLFVEASQLPDSNGWIKIDTLNNEIIGWNADRQSASIGPPLPNFRGYFVMKFNKPIAGYGTWLNEITKAGNLQQTGNECGGWVSFGSKSDTVLVKIGTSFISTEQARNNLNDEIPAWNFELVKNTSAATWNKYMSRIQVESPDKNDLGNFYSGMYHALLFPRQFSEQGLYYSAFDDKTHAGTSYNDYSLWDTYRAEHPLLIFLTPELVPGMIQSLLQMYDEGGYMPKWPNPTYTNIMIGTHADAVIADAIVKGVKGLDLQKAYNACMKDATVPPVGDSIKWWGDRDPWTGYEARAGLSWSLKLGYVPADKTAESVANTLESAYDDFCVAQVAKANGKTDDYNMLMKRSQFYRNLYNAKTGFMAPRNVNGSWHDDPTDGFTEGSKWTYLFCVFQDVPGLIDLMGGNKKFISKLDHNFTGGHYVHENEPGHHYTYLYDYAGAAWKTQLRVAHYRALKYHNTPRGLHGDEDCGQMSAWYMLSALGFYPVTPGTDVYAIGTPLFTKATMYIDPTDRSKKFEIVANNVSKKNIYIQRVYLNGKQLTSPFLHHADIENGGKLEFNMGSKPVKNW